MIGRIIQQLYILYLGLPYFAWWSSLAVDCYTILRNREWSHYDATIPCCQHKPGLSQAPSHYRYWSMPPTHLVPPLLFVHTAHPNRLTMKTIKSLCNILYRQSVDNNNNTLFLKNIYSNPYSMKISYSSLTVGDSRSHSAGGGSDELLLSSLMAVMCAGDPNLGDIAGEPVRKNNPLRLLLEGSRS